MDVAGHDVVLVVDGAAGGDGDHVRAGLLDKRGDLGALLGRDAVLPVRAFALGIVEALHLDGDYLVRAYHGADGADGLSGEARPVLDLLPAVLVRAVVEEGADELAGEVAVAGLELYPVGPGGHRALGGGDELGLDVVNLLDGQLVDGLGLDAGVVGRTGVPELEEYLRTVLVCGVGKAAKAGDEAVVVDARLEGQDARPVVVDYHGAGYNDTHAAGGDGLDVLDVAHGDGVVEVGYGLGHGQIDDAVFDGLAAYLNRFEKLVTHCSSSSSNKHGLVRGTHGYLTDVYAPGLIHHIDDVVREHLRAEVEALDALAVQAVGLAETHEGVDELLIKLFALSDEGELLYDDNAYTDQPLEFRISEIIREKTISELKDEMPHVIFVEVSDIEYSEEENEVWIRAFINVERDSQKGIVVGKGGENIRRIRKESFKEIKRIFPSSRLNLDLRVKAVKNWRSDKVILDKIFNELNAR